MKEIIARLESRIHVYDRLREKYAEIDDYARAYGYQIRIREVKRVIEDLKDL